MFTVSGAELQSSGLAIRNQRVRQTLLTATHPRPVRVEALVPSHPLTCFYVTNTRELNKNISFCLEVVTHY